MVKQKRINLIYFFLPLAILFSVLAFIYSKQTNIQLWLIFVVALIYIGFSLIHHYIDKSLTIRTALEYILIAGLVLVIILSYSGAN